MHTNNKLTSRLRRGWFAVVFPVLFLACAEDGAVGPQGLQGLPGDPGEQGPSGTDGTDGNTTSFYFQQGFKGYEGTTDITINQSGPSSPPDDPFLTVNTQAGANASVLLRFDDLDEVINPEMGSEEWLVNEAILYLRGEYASGSGDRIISLTIGLLDSSAALFDENVVTSEIANANENWPKSCDICAPAPDPIVPFPLSYTMTFETAEDNRGYSTLFAFRLSRSRVERWIKNPGTNKGIVFRLGSGSSGTFNFFSENAYSENASTELAEARPLLYINAERIDDNDNGRKRNRDEEDYLVQWDKMTNKEKMAPFYNRH